MTTRAPVVGATARGGDSGCGRGVRIGCRRRGGRAWLDKVQAGSSTWLMWRYTDAAIPDGLQAPPTVDVFKGTRADLDRLADK
jgi:hypothetical protein